MTATTDTPAISTNVQHATIPMTDLRVDDQPALTLPDIWRETIRPRHTALGHKNNIVRTETALNHWVVFAPDVLLSDITTALVNEFRVSLLQAGLDYSTARMYRTAIRALLREIDPSRFPRSGVRTTRSSGDIWTHLDRYLSEREVSDGYICQLECHVRDLEKFHGGVLNVADLTPVLVNTWLKSCAKLSTETRRSRRKTVLTLWRDAAELGLVAAPTRILRIQQRDKINPTWTAANVQRLLKACSKMFGYGQHGVKRSAYWKAYILAAWDSGLRGVDLRRLIRSQIRGDGCVVLVQHKTGRRIMFRLRPATVAAIDATYPPDRNFCFPLWGTLDTWRREAKRLVKLAGLKGGIGQLRHSSGTAVEIQYPGHGHEHLGNTRAVFERHYLDVEQTAFERPLPPDLTRSDSAKTDGGDCDAN